MGVGNKTKTIALKGCIMMPNNRTLVCEHGVMHDREGGVAKSWKHKRDPQNVCCSMCECLGIASFVNISGILRLCFKFFDLVCLVELIPEDPPSQDLLIDLSERTRDHRPQQRIADFAVPSLSLAPN